jgi:hypothetical protein
LYDELLKADEPVPLPVFNALLKVLVKSPSPQLAFDHFDQRNDLLQDSFQVIPLQMHVKIRCSCLVYIFESIMSEYDCR